MPPSMCLGKTPYPDRCPGKTPSKCPGKTSSRCPGKTPSRGPGKTPSRCPGKAPSRCPGKTPSRSPGNVPSRCPRPRCLGKTPSDGVLPGHLNGHLDRVLPALPRRLSGHLDGCLSQHGEDAPSMCGKNSSKRAKSHVCKTPSGCCNRDHGISSGTSLISFPHT